MKPIHSNQTNEPKQKCGRRFLFHVPTPLKNHKPSWDFVKSRDSAPLRKFQLKRVYNTDFFGIVFFGIFEVPQRVNGAIFLEKTVWSKGNEALVELIKNKRKEAGLTQTQVAKAFGQRQTWLSHLESGERRIDVVEFVRLSEVIGFSAVDELRKLIPIILEK